MSPPSHPRRFGFATALLFIVWLLLTASLAFDNLIVGLAVSALIAWLSAPQWQLLDSLKLSPKLPWFVLRYLLNFCWALILANVDMARRVLSPSLPINPAMVRVRTGLRSPFGQFLLANSITLTPGTLSIDIIGDELIVHWIDVGPGQDVDAATAAIAARFERDIKEFVE